jgi:hypothetical protein
MSYGLGFGMEWMVNRVSITIYQWANVIVCGVTFFWGGARNITKPNKTKLGQIAIETLVVVLVGLVNYLDHSRPVGILEFYLETTELIRSEKVRVVLNKEMRVEELENHPVMNPETVLTLERKTAHKHQNVKT